MKRSTAMYLLIFLLFMGLLSSVSCKRSSQDDPGMKPPAGFRIVLSGTANPSSLYISTAQPQVTSHITVSALNNDGTPVVGKTVVFQAGGYGYLDNFQISDVRTTNSSGVCEINYYIPAGAPILKSEVVYVTATLVDDSRGDNTYAQIFDAIPIEIIHTSTSQGFLLQGTIRTQAGTGVGEVVMELTGAAGHASGVAVTQSNGDYGFNVIPGWYGTITPVSAGYTYSPQKYDFVATNPVNSSISNLDFIAIFEGGNKLATDIATWKVPVEGGTQSVNVYNSTGEAAINYVVLPDSNWITVSPSSGVTPGQFAIVVDENTTGLERSGKVKVSSTDIQSSEVTITITQAKTDVSSNAKLAAKPTSLNVPGGGILKTMPVAINVYNSGSSEAIDYIITPNCYWVHVSKASGTTNDNFTVYVDPNLDTTNGRSCTITLTVTSSGCSNTQVVIRVNQAVGVVIAVSPAAISAPASGDVVTVDVTNLNTSEILVWTVVNDYDSWVNITPISGLTPGSFTVTVQANPTSSPRATTITVMSTAGASAAVTVTQVGS